MGDFFDYGPSNGGLLGYFGDQLGGGGGGLTPDQQAMQNQLGYYYRPDMVLPSGTNWQQPAGYSNLTPAQIGTVNQLGYYSQGDAAQPQSLWQKMLKGLGNMDLSQAKNAIAGVAGQQGTRPVPPLPPAPFHYPFLNPIANIYSRHSLMPGTKPGSAFSALQSGIP